MVECPEVVYWQGRADLCFVALPLIPTHFCLLGVLSARTGWPHEFGRRGIRTSLRASLTLDIHEVCADGRAGARCFERSNPAMLRQNMWALALARMCCACARVEAACMPVDGLVFSTAQTSWMRAELWGEGPALVGVNRVPFRNSFARFCCDYRPSALPLSRAALDQCVGAQLKGAHFSHVARTVRLVLGKTVHTACDGQSVCVCELCKCGLKPHAR